jgi:predicted ATP-grasp superfamily ATP-dependent carboligase
MRGDTPPAIVLGGGINGLGIIRNLGREGITVYCVLERPDPAAYSRYCRKSFLVSGFTQRADSVRSFLSTFPGASFSSRPVVFSTNDRTTLILSDLRDQMEDRYNFVTPDKQTAETLVVKSKFYESLVENRIEHPRVIAAGPRSDLTHVGEELGYPILVRPCISQNFVEVFGKKGFVANCESDLLMYYQQAAKHNLDIVFQEIIPGPATNVFGIAGYFDGNAHPLALFGYHRLREWPPMIGSNSLIESVPLRKLRDVKDVTLEYLTNLGYHGIMEAEFKLDPRDGIYKLLEVNARSWWQNSFPTRCGLNIILNAYLDSIGERTSYSEDYVAGIKWINFLEDVCASVAGNEIMRASWVNSLVGVKDYAFFDPHDLAPAASNVLFDLGAIDHAQGRLRPQVLRMLLRQLIDSR